MASLKYVLISDSNVRRNINKTNKRSCPQLAATTVLTCGDFSIFDESLSQVKDDTDVLILSCITNFLTSAPEDSMVGKRVEPVLDAFVRGPSTAPSSSAKASRR